MRRERPWTVRWKRGFIGVSTGSDWSGSRLHERTKAELDRLADNLFES